MSKEVVGVQLEEMEGPIRSALQTYQEISDGDWVFDTDNACKLELTPTKSNSARSETDAIFQGEQVGKLFVIAFKPGDGTGSEVNYQLKDLLVYSPYPRSERVVPRNKIGVHSEAHLTVLSHRLEDVHAEPQLYSGTYDLLGLVGSVVKKIGQLGHSETDPRTTFTVGYKDGERFCDPHAVYSLMPVVLQVCAFLAVSDEVHQSHPNILNGLNPQLPTKL